MIRKIFLFLILKFHYDRNFEFIMIGQDLENHAHRVF